MSSRAGTSSEPRPGTMLVSAARAGGWLRQAEQPQHDALRGVVHDLRQPAVCISALVASCRASLDKGQRPDEALRRIDDQARQMLALVAGLLDDGSPASTADTSAPVADIVVEAVAYLRLVHRVDARIRSAVDAGVGVQTSETSLRRAVVNVLDNAARAAGPEGHVVVSTRRRNGEVQVRVEDDGPGFGGLTAEHQVGLRSAAHQLSREGGRIDVSSSRRLGGALVTIVVPEAPRLGAATESQGPRHAASRL
jgi:signal transduction histidine kinase